MNTWAIFEGGFSVADGEAPPTIVNIVGGMGQVGTRPPTAHLGRAADGSLTFYSTQENWTETYNYLAGHNSVKLFTTAPAELLSAWLRNGAVRLKGNVLSVTITRAHDPSRGDSFTDGYRKFGPYTRRFLVASLAQQGDIAVEFGPPPAESWPVFFNPRSTALEMLDDRTVAALLDHEHSVLLPPWRDESTAGDPYFAINQGKQTGLTARNRLRSLAGRERWEAEEPLLITLWRAMDDAALRPEMLAGAQIEIEGLPASAGEMGEGTAAALKLPAAGSGGEELRFRHRLLFGPDGPEQMSALAEGVRAAMRSDLREAMGPNSTVSLVTAELPPIEQFGNDGLPRTANAEASIFNMLGAWAELDERAGAILRGPSAPSFAHHCHTGDVPAEARAVRNFWQMHLRPPSRRVFLTFPPTQSLVGATERDIDRGLAWWERYPFLAEGCSRELTHREMRKPTERLRKPWYEVPPSAGGWQVEAAPRDFGDILHAALLMPVGTRILWGGLAMLDHHRCLLDAGMALG